MSECTWPKNYEGMSRFRPPLNFELTGRSFSLVMDDGREFEISFPERGKIAVKGDGSSDGEYVCDVLKAEEDTYFVNYSEISEMPRKAVSFILDLEQDLVTQVNAYDGWNPKFECMVRTENIFGAIRRDDGTLNTVRHGYTEDMVGKAIHWNYSTLEVIHVYQDSHYYRLVFPQTEIEKRLRQNPDWQNPFDLPGIVYEEPAEYIKVKDGIYIFSMTEQNKTRQRGGGANLLFLMNLNRMYDVGRSFGTAGDGVSMKPENYTYGAFGEFVDPTEYMKAKSTYHVE